MLFYHIAHLLPGLCLHDCWFLFYWPMVGRRMFEGKRRIFCGGFVSVEAWACLCKPREGCEGQGVLLVHTMCLFLLHFTLTNNQHHTLFLVNPGLPACIFWKELFHGFDVSYCWLSSDVFSCFILCCFPFVFSEVKQSWVVLIWYFTCQVAVTRRNAPTHPRITYWKPQKAYNPLEVTQEELCLSGYYSISNSTSATRHHSVMT